MRRPLTAIASILLLSAASHASATRTLEGAAFSSPTDGYGLVVDQGASACVGRVGRTADGGAHFRPLVRVTSWPCGQGAPVSALAVDGQGDGFLYGPDLFVTHDGGRAWSPAAHDGAVVAVGAIGRSVWLVERIGFGAAGARCSLRLLESADGGRHWAPALRQPPGVPASCGGAAFNGGGESRLLRVSASAAYVVSDGPHGVPLSYTGDGGATWSRRAFPCATGAGVSVALSAAPDGALFAVCAAQPSAGSQGKAVAVSIDGGRSWSVRLRCLFFSGCHSPLMDGYLGEVVATSASTAYVIGDRSPLLVTRDGGRSWRALAAVGDTNGEPAQVAFFGADDGIVLGRANTATAAVTIWHTRDGGASWTAVQPRLG